MSDETPETRCECGHDKEVHMYNRTVCVMPKCSCGEFRPAAPPDTGTGEAREGMTEERLAEIRRHHEARYSPSWLHTDELLTEVDRLRARPDTGDARLREAADPEAVRLVAQLLAGVRDGFTNSEAADLTQRAEAWLLRAALPPDPRPEEPQR